MKNLHYYNIISKIYLVKQKNWSDKKNWSEIVHLSDHQCIFYLHNQSDYHNGSEYTSKIRINFFYSKVRAKWSQNFKFRHALTSCTLTCMAPDFRRAMMRCGFWLFLSSFAAFRALSIHFPLSSTSSITRIPKSDIFNSHADGRDPKAVSKRQRN